MLSLVSTLVLASQPPVLSQAAFAPEVTPTGAISEIRWQGEVVASELGLLIPGHTARG